MIFFLWSHDAWSVMAIEARYKPFYFYFFSGKLRYRNYLNFNNDKLVNHEIKTAGIIQETVYSTIVCKFKGRVMIDIRC